MRNGAEHLNPRLRDAAKAIDSIEVLNETRQVIDHALLLKRNEESVIEIELAAASSNGGKDILTKTTRRSGGFLRCSALRHKTDTASPTQTSSKT